MGESEEGHASSALAHREAVVELARGLHGGDVDDRVSVVSLICHDRESEAIAIWSVSTCVFFRSSSFVHRVCLDMSVATEPVTSVVGRIQTVLNDALFELFSVFLVDIILVSLPRPVHIRSGDRPGFEDAHSTH